MVKIQKQDESLRKLPNNLSFICYTKRYIADYPRRECTVNIFMKILLLLTVNFIHIQKLLLKLHSTLSDLEKIMKMRISLLSLKELRGGRKNCIRN